MATGFGTNVWLGFATETTLGVYVAPTKYVEITEESLKLEQSWISVPTLRSASQSQRVRSKKGISGGFKANLSFRGFEQFFRHALGTNATTGAGPIYTHTMTLSSSLPVGMSLHLNRDAASVGSAFKYEGCQIQKLTISQAVEEIAVLEVEFIGLNEGTLAVATPTFPAFEQVDWEDFSLTVNSGSTLAKSFELSIENNIASDRYVLGDRARVGLGRGGPRKITGKWTQEFDSLTNYNLFANLNTPFTIVATWYNDATGYEVTANVKAVLTNAEVSVSDAGPIMGSFEFEAFQLSTANDELSVVIKNLSSTI